MERRLSLERQQPRTMSWTGRCLVSGGGGKEEEQEEEEEE